MISVIIPAYIPTQKHHLLFLRSLLSLKNQTFKNFEVVLVLNGCYIDYDSLVESTKQFELDINFIKLSEKLSSAIARNKGISNSKYDLIALLDADDQYHPEKLKKQYDFITKNSEYDFITTLAKDVYPNGEIKDSCYLPGQYMTHEQISKVIFDENVICNGSIMFKKKSFLDLGGYDEKNKPGNFWPAYGKPMWEDWDLFLRAISSGMKFFTMPERLYYWSVGTSVER